MQNVSFAPLTHRNKLVDVFRCQWLRLPSGKFPAGAHCGCNVELANVVGVDLFAYNLPEDILL